MLDDTKEVLTVRETAQVMRVSEPTIYKAIREGRIPSIRLGDRHLIPRVRLQALLNGEGEGKAAA
jgi:excisionase family DNA binding protein